MPKMFRDRDLDRAFSSLLNLGDLIDSLSSLYLDLWILHGELVNGSYK